MHVCRWSRTECSILFQGRRFKCGRAQFFEAGSACKVNTWVGFILLALAGDTRDEKTDTSSPGGL